jgi:hypothetical protein
VSIAAWWARYWVPRFDFEKQAEALLTAISGRENLRRRLADAETRLEMHMEVSKLIQARATWGEPNFRVGVQGARRLRLEIVVDDRVLLGYQGKAPVIQEALADEAAYKMKQAVLTLDFALAGAIMKEARDVPPR